MDIRHNVIKFVLIKAINYRMVNQKMLELKLSENHGVSEAKKRINLNEELDRFFLTLVLQRFSPKSAENRSNTQKHHFCFHPIILT